MSPHLDNLRIYFGRLRSRSNHSRGRPGGGSFSRRARRVVKRDTRAGSRSSPSETTAEQPSSYDGDVGGRPSQVYFTSAFNKFAGLFRHTGLGTFSILCADLLGNFHGAKLWPTHGAEMSGFGAIMGQGFIVKLTSPVGVKAQVELIFPTELEACFGEGIIPKLCSGPSMAKSAACAAIL